MTTHDHDVLVVGAGPSGLTAAVALARRGVAVRIIDTGHGPADHSNALVVHPRTLEIMDLLEVVDEMVARGYAAPGLDLGSDPEQPMRMELSGLDTRFPYILILPQSDTERILAARLEDLGTTVEWDTTFVGYTADPGGGVTVTLRRADGTSEQVRSRYLVGADGAGSTVRDAAGIGFSGERYPDVFINAEVKVDGGLVTGGVSQYFSDAGVAFVVPFRDGYFRIAAIDTRNQDVDPSDELTLAQVQDAVDAIVPTRPRLRDPRWLTYWRSGVAQAQKYRAGDVFLAGDAAHVHSPAGGQGMNTGIQDAMNLGWKLAAVVRGEAPSDVLDTYAAERHPVGARAISMSHTITRVFRLRDERLRRALERVLGFAISRGPVQQAVAGMISGIAIDYRDQERTAGSLQADLRSVSSLDAVRAGDRLPDAALWAGDGPGRSRPTRLYDVLRDPRPTLLLTATTQRADGSARARMATLARTVDATTGGAVRTIAIFRQGTPSAGAAAGHEPATGAAGDGPETLIDASGQFAARTGADDGHALFVRPDGYVGFHRRGHEAAIRALFDRWVTRPDPKEVAA